MTEFTIPYRGYQIDPVSDPDEVGNWMPCPVDQAEMFLIYPPCQHASTLNVEAYTLETAMRAVDLEIDVPFEEGEKT